MTEASSPPTVTEGDLLWSPSEERVAAARVTAYRSWLAASRGVETTDDRALHAWSTSRLAEFWESVWEWFGVQAEPYDDVLPDPAMPGTRWFPGARLNYAEHALRPGEGKGDGDLAVLFEREDGHAERLTYGELRAQVGAAAAGLRRLGVGPGDRVAAVLPNCPQALVAFLATASLGAVWSSCSPDFGSRSLVDRFSQIGPTVLIGVDGYRYNDRRHATDDTLRQLRAALPGLAATVVVPYLDPAAEPPDATMGWGALTAEPAAPTYTRVAFDAPLWILYSSGTTGLPKPIVQGQGGILLEHIKALGLHGDLGPGDRFFWFTTTGWMMWNYLVSGLLVGASVVLYDGSPARPDLGRLWRLADALGVTCFGTSAPYLASCQAAGVVPREIADLTALRSLGSTGAPLSPEGFAWVYTHVKADLHLASVSGGTDVCTAFVLGLPTRPVHAGEIQTAGFGCAVATFDEHGKPVTGEVGELVITAPMPSMPVFFWGDEDGSRLRESYFATYPGVWRHGDWAKRTERGGFVIYGRSDSTLNRGGVRIGTAEFYRVVEEIPGVADSLVVDTGGLDAGGAVREGELLLFVVLDAAAELDDKLRGEIRDRLRRTLSPRHVPDRIEAIPAVPRTLNGKKLEVPVKRLLSGVPLERAVAAGAVADLSALDPFLPARDG